VPGALASARPPADAGCPPWRRPRRRASPWPSRAGSASRPAPTMTRCSPPLALRTAQARCLRPRTPGAAAQRDRQRAPRRGGQMAACARPLAWTGECAAARATPLRTPVVSRWVAAHCVRRAGHPHCKPAPGCGCRTSPVVAHARGERAQRYDARRSHSSAPPACVISNPHIWQASWLSDADTCVNS